MQADLISVIIPCYNTEKYLAEAIESVLLQQLNTQIIVVDDGSTDKSVDIAQSFGDKVHYVWQANAGTSAARNKGLQFVKGEYLSFLDADDRWVANSLQRHLRLLKSHTDIDYAHGQVEHFISPELLQELNDAIPDIALGRLAGCSLFRTHSFMQVGDFNPELRAGEMIDWLLRAKEQGLQQQGIEHVILQRRIHTENTVKKEAQLKQQYLKALRAAIKRQQ